jgi:hypothetical protein
VSVDPVAAIAQAYAGTGSGPPSCVHGDASKARNAAERDHPQTVGARQDLPQLLGVTRTITPGRNSTRSSPATSVADPSSGM